jgi:hypothetical protein
MYGVDIKDLTNYDLIVDTTHAAPDEVADTIIAGFTAWQRDKSYRAALISPLRLNYPDDAVDAEEISRLAAMLDSGEPIPEVQLVENEGEFYVKSGAASALAYSFNSASLVPAVLVAYSGEAERASFVKMKNSL